MTPEQQLAWNLLKNDYAEMAHSLGKVLSQLPANQFVIGFNDAFRVIMDWPGYEGVRAVKTWLSYYGLAINPDDVECFEEFDAKFGTYIRNRHPEIKIYDPPGG